MKKFKNMNFAYGAVALLIGAMTFSACSSDEEVVNVNPSFDGESVKTQFAINIPHAAQTKTRMTSENTQVPESDAKPATFLGMQDIRLYPFALEGNISATTPIASVITLANLTTSNIYGSGNADRSSKIYSDVTIPVGTNYFLFYGQAVRENDASDFANGNMETNFDGATSVNAITFALKDILDAGTALYSNAEAVNLLKVLNAVESVDGWSSSDAGSDLHNLYEAFTGTAGNSVTGMKAGSASSIKAALESLYNAASKLNIVDGSVAGKIMEAIVTDGVFSVTGDAANGYTLTTANTFPRNLNLPDGAVAVAFSSNAEAGKKFSYVSSDQVIGSSDNQINVANVTYPASLYYYAKTTLKAYDNSVAANDWPKTTSAWASGFTETGWGDKVLATTRSIAMKDNINYGVGNLELAVKTAANTLMDREVNGVQRTITVGDNTFPITAILIGGQPASVDYAFAPFSTTTFVKTIYDKVEPGKYAAYVNTPTVCNYTLALPNTKASPDKVQFAIELENKSDVEFVGHDGQIIYKGSKFYLLGSLDPAATNNITKPEGVNNVFESDYKTTANVTIKSLKEAYNVIPDLRATNLEFGLSVDLEWKKGITFDVEIE